MNSGKVKGERWRMVKGENAHGGAKRQVWAALDQIVRETVANGGAKEMLSRSSEPSWMKEQEKIKDDRHIMEAHSRK